jgi:hypothetical protein
MAFPGAKPQRAVYTTAQRVRDLLGKGQEILPSFKGTVLSTGTTILGIPEVDIIVVDIAVIGEGFSTGTLDILAPASYDVAAGSTNRLVAQIVDAGAGDDLVTHPALLGLNGNKVAAGQPILARGGGTLTLAYVQVSYILDTGATSY